MLTPQQAAPALLWPFKTLYYGWGVAATSMIMAFATVQLYGPVLSVFVKPIGDDMGWNRTEIAFAFTIGSFLGSMFTTAIGRFLDRHGARMVATLAAMFIAAMLLGLAIMQAPWHMWIFFGLARAVSIAGVQLGATVAVANWFIQKRGRAAAMGAFGQRFGQAVVPLMLLPLILGLSWRSAYVALSISTLLLAALPAFLFLRRRPEDYCMLPDGASPDGYRSEPPSPREVARAAVDSTPWTVREAFRTRAFWLIVVTMATISFAQTATNLHAAASFQEKGISFAASATIVFVFAMTSAISTFPWGWLIDRLHIRYVMMASATLYCASMFLIMNATTYLGAVAFGVVFGTAAGAWTLGFRLLIPNYFGRRSTGAIRGATAPIIAFIGPVGPTLGGAIRDITGDYELAFAIFAGVFALAFVAMAFAKPPTHRPIAPDELPVSA
ncbi:MAG: MFS transporter [Chloroflexi bacterium]|nr:MFS transporter [Chloroflexota bacterium]